MSQTENTPVMPAVFAGHGSPMNAIESNQFTENWKKLGEAFDKTEEGSNDPGMHGRRNEARILAAWV